MPKRSKRFNYNINAAREEQYWKQWEQHYLGPSVTEQSSQVLWNNSNNLPINNFGSEATTNRYKSNKYMSAQKRPRIEPPQMQPIPLRDIKLCISDIERNNNNFRKDIKNDNNNIIQQPQQQPQQQQLINNINISMVGKCWAQTCLDDRKKELTQNEQLPQINSSSDLLINLLKNKNDDNKNIIIEASTSQINKEEEDDDCLIIYQKICNKEENKNLKRKIKSEEITEDLLKEITQDQLVLVDVVEGSGEEEEDIDMREDDVDMREQIEDNYLENNKQLGIEEIEKEEENIEEGRDNNEEKEEVNDKEENDEEFEEEEKMNKEGKNDEVVESEEEKVEEVNDKEETLEEEENYKEDGELSNEEKEEQKEVKNKEEDEVREEEIIDEELKDEEDERDWENEEKEEKVDLLDEEDKEGGNMEDSQDHEMSEGGGNKKKGEESRTSENEREENLEEHSICSGIQHFEENKEEEDIMDNNTICSNNKKVGYLKSILKGGKRYQDFLKELNNKKKAINLNEENIREGVVQNDVQMNSDDFENIPTTSSQVQDGSSSSSTTSMEVQVSPTTSEEIQNNLLNNIPIMSNEVQEVSGIVPTTSNDVQNVLSSIPSASNEFQNISNNIPVTTKEYQKNKDLKKYKNNNNNGFLTSPEIENLIKMPPKTIKNIPLGDQIIIDPRLDDEVNYCLKSLKCLNNGLKLTNFNIKFIENLKKEKEEKNKFNNYLPINMEINEENNNNNNEQQQSTSSDINGNNKGQVESRFFQTGLQSIPNWGQKHWKVNGGAWANQPPHIPPPPLGQPLQPPAPRQFYLNEPIPVPPPQPLNIIQQPCSNDGNNNNEQNLQQEQQQETKKRKFDSDPQEVNLQDSGTEAFVGGNSPNTSNTSKVNQNTLDALKLKIEENENLRQQLAKKDEENRRLNSIQVSFDSLSERLKTKDKQLAECKGRLSEVELERDELSKAKYLIELNQKNTNTLRDATKTSALIKIENENKKLKDEIAEQQKKYNEGIKRSDDKCKRLERELKQQKDQFTESLQNQSLKHKNEKNACVNKALQDLQSKLKLKDEEINLLKHNIAIKDDERSANQIILQNENQSLKKEIVEERNKLQNQISEFAEWKENELAKNTNELIKYNEEILKMKNELEESLKREENLNIKYNQLLEVVEELKKTIFIDNPQLVNNSNNNNEECQKLYKKQIEKEYAEKWDKLKIDLCEEQQRIKIKKEQFDSIIENKQKCEECSGHLTIINALNNILAICRNSGCKICGATQESQQSSSFVQVDTSTPTVIHSPKTPPKANESSTLSRKRSIHGSSVISINFSRNYQHSSSSQQQQLNSSQGFNNSGSSDIEPGRQTVDSVTSSSISIPPIDPDQTGINNNNKSQFDNLNKLENERLIELQNKNLEENRRLIQTKSVADVFSLSPPPQPPNLSPQINSSINSTFFSEQQQQQFNNNNNFIGNSSQIAAKNQILRQQSLQHQTQMLQNQNWQQQQFGICSVQNFQQQQQQLIQQQLSSATLLYPQQTQQQICSTNSNNNTNSIVHNQQFVNPLYPSTLMQCIQNNNNNFQQNNSNIAAISSDQLLSRQAVQQNIIQQPTFQSSSSLQQIQQQQIINNIQQQQQPSQYQNNSIISTSNNSGGRPIDPRITNSALFQCFNKVLENFVQQSNSQQNQQQTSQVNNNQNSGGDGRGNKKSRRKKQ